MSFIKKIACVLVVCALALPYTAVFAENNNEYIDRGALAILDFDELSESVSLFSESEPITEDETKLFDYIGEQLLSHPQKIDVSEFNMEVDRFYQLFNNYMSKFIQYEHPELFFFYGIDHLADEDYRYDRDTDTFRLLSITPTYSMPLEDIERIQKDIDNEAAKAISGIDQSMSDTEKALYIHDYIATNYEYDRTLQVRTLDTMVEQKKGVCQGYSYLFKYIMNKLGFECVTVPSTECHHMWNKIKIDGEWYNVDVTYDDPLPDLSSHIIHMFFLVNDDEIKELDPIRYNDRNVQVSCHYTWDSTKWDDSAAEVSESKKYENSVLHTLHGPTAYVDGTFLCFDSINELCKIIFNENVLRVDYSLTANYKWFAPGSDRSYFKGYYSTLAALDGKLYFNSPDAVYLYTMYPDKQGSIEEIYKHSGNDISNTYLYGLTVKNDTLYAEYVPNYGDGHRELIEIDTPKPEPSLEPIIEVAPCTSETKATKDETTGDVTVTVEVTISDEAKERLGEKKPKIRIAKYDENGLFKGFEEYDEESGTAEFTANSDCRIVKTFIWGANNEPFSYANPFDILQSFIQ